MSSGPFKLISGRWSAGTGRNVRKMDCYQHESSYWWARHQPTSMFWWSTRYYARLVIANAPRQGARLCEIGHGMGHLLGALEEHFETVGVDISAHANREAPKNAPRSRFVTGDIAAGLDFPDGCFGVIVAKHVLEHVREPKRALAECARLLEPGGLLLFSTPNTTSIGAGWKGERWYGRDEPTHISVLPPTEWIGLTRKAGFAVERVFGDGLWNVPYVPWIPAPMQLAFFGLPAFLQVLLTGTWMPLRLGESLLVIAHAVSARSSPEA